MSKRAPALLMLGLLLTSFVFAKDKPKSTLPPYVLHARTIVVIVDPKAGVSIDDPQANRVAQKDVETAPEPKEQAVHCLLKSRKYEQQQQLRTQPSRIGAKCS